MPGAIADIAADRLPKTTAKRLRKWRHGSASYKVDWVLNGPVPWTAAACRRAGTVHVGGTVEELVASEARLADGPLHERPFVLVSQPSLIDASRAPEGHHVVWGYSHVPHGDTTEAVDRIEAQIERFAPGFGERIVARHTMDPADLERHNANYVGGDIGGGAFNLRNVVLRPTPTLDPYHLGSGMFIASAASPPGAGVHGMAGLHAARSVLRRTR
jgi:phytoene dehydrogenase-like protein